MTDFAKTLEGVLQGNRKNIADVISQDISSLLLAHLLLENPELEEEINFIFEHLYRGTTKQLENLLYDFVSQQGYSMNQEEESQLKAEIQKFVWELIQEKQGQVQDQMYWLSKLKRDK